jgi:hypothetical protein
MNSRRRILYPSRWISEPYHNDGCKERWFALVPMFAAPRKSASSPRSTTRPCSGRPPGDHRTITAALKARIETLEAELARLTEWRERALAGAATALKECERDDRDDEIARLKSKVGEITMDNELLYVDPCMKTPDELVALALLD